jgi:hypothetical protein
MRNYSISVTDENNNMISFSPLTAESGKRGKKGNVGEHP